MLYKFAVCTLAGALFSSAAFAQDYPEGSPEQAAARFMAAFYSVKPEQVTVTMLEQDGRSASASTQVEGQPVCTLDMAPAPQPQAKYGWLIGGMSCDKAAGK